MSQQLPRTLLLPAPSTTRADRYHAYNCGNFDLVQVDIEEARERIKIEELEPCTRCMDFYGIPTRGQL